MLPHSGDTARGETRVLSSFSMPFRTAIQFDGMLSLGCGLSNEYQAPVGILDMELRHPVFSLKQISDSVPILKRFNVLPHGTDTTNLDVYLGMPPNTPHDLF